MSHQKIVHFITGKFWKFNYYSSLDVKDLLNLLKTCKHLKQQKSYIYKLIYAKITFQSPTDQYGNMIIMTIYNKTYTNIRELIILIKSNKILQDMFIRHSKKKPCCYHNSLYDFSHIILNYINKEITFKTAIKSIINNTIIT